MNTAVAERPAVPSDRTVALGVVEDAWTFDCAGARLVGVLSTPAVETGSSGSAVVIVVGGPQYRVGAHRQFVQLARGLARAGHAVLRFDRRGMGDSDGDPRSFEASGDDIHAAIGAMRARLPHLRRLVLFGLCDGASAALLCLASDVRGGIDGLCLLNPWARSEATLARTHLKHYYRRRLADRGFWRKLLAGGVGSGQWRDFFRSLQASRRRAAPRVGNFRNAMAAAWRDFDGELLLLLSDEDLTAREFIEHAQTSDEWRGLLERPNVRRVTLAGADHTLSTTDALVDCETALRSWLARLAEHRA